MSTEQSKDLPAPKDKPESELTLHSALGNAPLTLDLSGLTPEQIQELKKKHAELAIDSQDRVMRIATDLQALDRALGTMADKTKQADAEGTSVTVTKAQDDTLGRTEIMMGTSDTAKAGKFSRSQAGDNSSLWITVAVIIGTAIIIAALLK